jgi:hypothetical protein
VRETGAVIALLHNSAVASCKAVFRSVPRGHHSPAKFPKGPAAVAAAAILPEPSPMGSCVSCCGTKVSHTVQLPDGLETGQEMSHAEQKVGFEAPNPIDEVDSVTKGTDR